ncbi:MAG TPA: hypothetical protein VF838_11375 [Trebonia sp.]
MSVTMQPRNDEPPADAVPDALAEVAGADDAADVVVVAAGALDVLLPHAAITRLAATAAAAAINAECFTVSSTGRVVPVPRRDETSPSLDCRKINSR